MNKLNEEDLLESVIQQDVQIESSKLSHRLFRNNSGSFKDQTGRQVFFGLGNISKKSNAEYKSSDLIGFMPVIITKEMVGKKVAVFIAAEVKKSNWKYMSTDREVAQKKFLDVVNINGGLGIFVNSVDSYIKQARDYLSKLMS